MEILRDNKRRRPALLLYFADLLLARFSEVSREQFAFPSARSLQIVLAAKVPRIDERTPLLQTASELTESVQGTAKAIADNNKLCQ